jgi:hypothetical protein
VNNKSAPTTSTRIHGDWLPNVSAGTWHRTHSWTVSIVPITLFGETIYISAVSLSERCTCLHDDEPSHFDAPYEQCMRCELCTSSVHRRRMNTSYVDDENNFTVQCDVCFEDSEQMWADQWAEYYAGCL